MTEQRQPGPARRQTRQVFVGSVAVGGGAAVSVQTMTKTDTCDVAGTVAQIEEVAALGCDIVRVAVPDERAAQCLAEIKGRVDVPLVADIHFRHELALQALDAGVDGLRINPGNIGGPDRVREVVKAASERRTPIRIGVNSGSLEKSIEEEYGGRGAEALVASAIRHIAMMEDMEFRDIKVSVKASDVTTTIEAYRLLALRIDYPLHVGVTEAGTFLAGTVRSSVGIGVLLAEGIGDTIRVSLTDTPAREVKVGLELLRCLGLRPPGASVISCPTCGRVSVNVVEIAMKVEEELEKYYLANPWTPRPVVAVMGCMVNGPGEAKHADIALAGGVEKFAVYVDGRHVANVNESAAVDAVLEHVEVWRPQQT